MSPNRPPLQHPSRVSSINDNKNSHQLSCSSFPSGRISCRPLCAGLERSVDTAASPPGPGRFPTKLLNNLLRFRFSPDYDEQVLPLPDPGNPAGNASKRRDFDPTAQSQMKLRRFV